MRLSWILLTAGIGLLAGRLAWAEIPQQLRFYIKRSRVTQAYDMLMPLLEESPDDPELHAVYGSLMAQTGMHADAITAFAFSDGSQWYAASGMRQHAASLRAMGLIDEAVAIRQLSRLNPRRNETSDIVTFLELVDDYREGRRWEEGQEVLDELLGLAPDGAKAWAVATWFHTERGDLDEAHWAAWRAMQLADPFESKLARANLYMKIGDLDGAEEVLKAAKKRRIRHIIMGSLLAELERLKGNPAEAVELTRSARYNATTHISLRAVEVRSLIDLKAYDEAQEVLQRIGDHYRLNPKYGDLVVELAAARASSVETPE
jgi:predicted Zn-dependent protease